MKPEILVSPWERGDCEERKILRNRITEKKSDEKKAPFLLCSSGQEEHERKGAPKQMNINLVCLFDSRRSILTAGGS
jgi:hypothetical protein